jgi:hypothetical protein
MYGTPRAVYFDVHQPNRKLAGRLMRKHGAPNNDCHKKSTPPSARMLPRVIGGPREARFPSQCVRAVRWNVKCDIQIRRPAQVISRSRRNPESAAGPTTFRSSRTETLGRGARACCRSAGSRPTLRPYERANCLRMLALASVIFTFIASKIAPALSFKKKS